MLRKIRELGFVGRCSLVSCQFALHYAFETEEAIRTLLTTVSESLAPGGYFIGTIPYANRIVYPPLQFSCDNNDRSRVLKSPDLSFGNQYYTVKFEDKSFPKFGAKYTFFLQDAVHSVPEYLVHFETLVRYNLNPPHFFYHFRLADEAGMRFVQQQHFESFFAENIRERENVELLARMRRGRPRDLKSIPPDMWEIFRTYKTSILSLMLDFYDVFAFQKKGEAVSIPAPQRHVDNYYPPEDLVFVDD